MSRTSDSKPALQHQGGKPQRPQASGACCHQTTGDTGWPLAARTAVVELEPAAQQPRSTCVLEWVGRTWVESSVWVERTAVCVGHSTEARAGAVVTPLPGEAWAACHFPAAPRVGMGGGRSCSCTAFSRVECLCRRTQGQGGRWASRPGQRVSAGKNQGWVSA